MKTHSTVHHGRGVESFLAEHGADVTGVIAGFDRLRLRASLRWLYQPSFMKRYLCEAGVLLKDFGAYAAGVSQRIRAAAHAFAAREWRPVRSLHSTARSKEELARTLAERDWVRAGLIGLFDIVEPCLTYFVRGDRAAHRLQLELRPGKCLHHYFYFQHAEFGLMHLRAQSWFPLQVTVCLNGWLWLSRQLDRAGLGHVQRDNAFAVAADLARAQQPFSSAKAGRGRVARDEANAGIFLNNALLAGGCAVRYDGGAKEWRSGGAASPQRPEFRVEGANLTGKSRLEPGPARRAGPTQDDENRRPFLKRP